MVFLTEVENTLWGAVVEKNGCYEHKSERPVHISMASLDTSSKFDQYVPVLVQQGSNSYILCTLHAPAVLQQPLELEINKGETVTFSVNANGVVHLTGYYISEPDMDEMLQQGGHAGHGNEEDEDDVDDHLMQGDSDDDDSEEDDDEDDDDEEEEEDNPSKKRKLGGAASNGSNKKNKNEQQEDDDEDEDEEDDGEEEGDDDDDEDGEDGEEEEDDDDDDSEEDEAPQLTAGKSKQNGQQQQQQPKRFAVNGVQIEELKVGNGAEAKKGKQVQVYYAGKLKQNGKQFDSCLKGKPFKFRLGAGDVIQGWDIGVSGMKVGGKRILTIPPNLAYGNKRVDIIPANSTLVFEVELKAVN